MLKYFFHFFDHFCRSSEQPDIRELCARVTRSDDFVLGQDVAPRPTQMTVSHWLCPGLFSIPGARLSDFLGVLPNMAGLSFHQAWDMNHAEFNVAKNEEAHIVYVFRNPLDVYRSYADIFEARSKLQDRKPYPFNPMVPFGLEQFNSTSDRPFEHFMSEFENSGFAEYFAAHVLSFLRVKELYPGRVSIFRYEDIQSDRRRYLEAILKSAQMDVTSSDRLHRAFEMACEATGHGRMKSYEATLGHALSGAQTYYGEENSSHVSSQPRHWREVFAPRSIEYMVGQLRKIDPILLQYLPEDVVKTTLMA